MAITNSHPLQIYHNMSGIINKIKTKTKEAFEWLVSKAKAIFSRVETWIKRVRRHQSYIDEVLESTPIYTPEAPDIKLSEEIKARLNELVPTDMVEYLEHLSPEERGQFIEQRLLPEIASIMGIEYEEFEWFQAERGLCGFYNHSQKKIALNAIYLYSDSNKMLTMLLNTIIHECKHARQWAAVDGVDYGYSREQIEKWKRNFEDYISCRESDEGYAKQPVEFDASMFANTIYDENRIFQS